MAKATTMNDLDIDQSTEIAALYYLQEVTQEDLARRYNMSRSRISRVLKRAREMGIVSIQVRANPNLAWKFEAEFQRRFGLNKLLVAINQPTEEEQRNTTGALVAAYLDQILTDGMTVAVGMGRNVASITEAPSSATPRKLLFAPSIGGSVHGAAALNPDHIARRLEQRFGGHAKTLYAPAIVATRELKEALLRNETVKETLDCARRADVALVGLGDLSEDSNLIRMGLFTPQELTQARVAGTVGDVMGHDFISIDGRSLGGMIEGRVIGLGLQELRNINNVIAIASEATKTAIILGALRTGAINTLATSLANAAAVIALDDATKT
ncbi:sugar-binding transcriptional regulator [Neorhizobium sp. P12A]|uniref:sugar-binding transcriptional regulator n=1 Tax=Rhizobium/Agrobacterium group TaxID=227290 RepID=UPI001042DB58|nr:MULTISPECIES: sugar-binding transcriptional regulator [Rhizobium/Agrobacterium group]KAA0691945.1 sugar-binding transcriptional regulator [Neorhizobium sp. P12A]TCR74789.1 DNA-binding transcriptional regulator LsrR (DeoR family) [Rhizobium sp. BK376]